MKKELHLANNIKELNDLTQKNFKNSKPIKLYNSAEKIFQTGLRNLHDGDEETAYILFVRFILIYDHLYKVNSDKVYTKQRLGSEYNTVVEQLEKLKQSLNDRYVKEKKIEELMPTITIDEPKPEAKPKTNDFPSGYISCSELFKLLESKLDIVILDSRPSKDYQLSSMKHPSCANIPEEIIKSGLSANMLGKSVPNESRSHWDRRWKVSVTVLLDWSSTKDTITASKLSVLKEILVQWDTAMINNNPPVILNGGYLEWLQMYPMRCTNPDVVYEVQNSVLNELLDLDTIEYPSTDESTPARHLKPPSLQPVFDRATKPVASLDSIRSQQKNIANQEIDLNIKQIENEQNLNDLRNKRHLEAEEGMRLELQNREEKLLEDNAALEKKKEELNKENEELRKKLQNSSPVEESKDDGDIRQRLLLEAREKKKPAPTIPFVVPPSNKRNIEDQEPLRRRKPFIGKPLTVEPGLTGLKNFGATCYSNSVVQCLSNTRRVRDFFLLTNYEAECNPNTRSRGNVARTFGEVVQALWSGCFKVFTPTDFKDTVAKYAPRFHGYDQQDAHEFLISLTNWVHDDLKKDIERPIQVCWTPKEKDWVEQTDGKYSIILETFFGQVKNIIHCKDCTRSKEKFEIFENLTLPLKTGGPTCTLADCFNEYFKLQTVHGYKCPRCGNYDNIVQKMSLVSHPPVLVILLKRFSNIVEKGYVGLKKNDMGVIYPLNNMSVFNKRYNLYGVVHHLGDLVQGHYYAVCRNMRSGKWYKYDDTNVKEVDLQTVLRPESVYILFYQTVEEEQLGRGDITYQ